MNAWAFVYRLHASHPSILGTMKMIESEKLSWGGEGELHITYSVYRTYSSNWNVQAIKTNEVNYYRMFLLFLSPSRTLFLASLRLPFFAMVLLRSTRICFTMQPLRQWLLLGIFLSLLFRFMHKLLVYFAMFIICHRMMFIVVLPEHKLSRHENKKNTKTNGKFNIAHKEST